MKYLKFLLCITLTACGGGSGDDSVIEAPAKLSPADSESLSQATRRWNDYLSCTQAKLKGAITICVKP